MFFAAMSDDIKSGVEVRFHVLSAKWIPESIKSQIGKKVIHFDDCCYCMGLIDFITDMLTLDAHFLPPLIR